MIWTLAFWKGAAERAIKTAAEVVVGYITVGVTGITDLDWPTVGSVTAAATLASVLVSIGNADFTAGVDPTLLD